MIWKDGTSKGQVKLKLEEPVDLQVKSIIPGKEGTKNEGRPGSLECVSSDGKLSGDVTVKNEKMRKALEENPNSFLNRIMVVISNDVLEPGENNDLHSLFLPRFLTDTPRTDKDISDDLQRVKDIFESAKMGKGLVNAD